MDYSPRSFRGKGRGYGGQGRNYSDRSQSRSIRSTLATRFESSLALLYTYIQAAIKDLQSTTSDQLSIKIDEYNRTLKVYQQNADIYRAWLFYNTMNGTRDYITLVNSISTDLKSEYDKSYAERTLQKSIIAPNDIFKKEYKFDNFKLFRIVNQKTEDNGSVLYEFRIHRKIRRQANDEGTSANQLEAEIVNDDSDHQDDGNE